MQQQQHEQSSLDLASFLAGLPPDVKSQVFASSWTAQALFRALTPLEKQYILRLMYVDASVSAGARCHKDAESGTVGQRGGGDASRCSCAALKAVVRGAF